MQTGTVWLIYRAHRTIPKRVEVLSVLSDGFDELGLLAKFDMGWEKIGNGVFHAYDDQWEYTCSRWQIEDSRNHLKAV